MNYGPTSNLNKLSVPSKGIKKAFEKISENFLLARPRKHGKRDTGYIKFAPMTRFTNLFYFRGTRESAINDTSSKCLSH